MLKKTECKKSPVDFICLKPETNLFKGTGSWELHEVGITIYQMINLFNDFGHPSSNLNWMNGTLRHLQKIFQHKLAQLCHIFVTMLDSETFYWMHNPYQDHCRSIAHFKIYFGVTKKFDKLAAYSWITVHLLKDLIELQWHTIIPYQYHNSISCGHTFMPNLELCRKYAIAVPYLHT